MSGTGTNSRVDSGPYMLAECAHRVLIVEREKALRQFLDVVLKDEQVAVTGASSIYEAVGQLKAERFDLILMNSFEFLRDPFGPTRPVREAAGSAPVVLFTGYPVKPEVAVAAGFADVITHPVDLDTLTARIRALLPGASTTPQYQKQRA